MKWSQIPVILVLLVPACSFLVQSEEHFDGNYPGTDSGAAGGAAGAVSGDAAGDAAGGIPASAGAGGVPDGAGGVPERAGAAGQSEVAGAESEVAGATSASGGASSPGPCVTNPVCMPGAVETAKQACGACATGTQTRTRTCSASTCNWGAWSAWGACSGVTAICTPKQTSACTNGDPCGQRTCSDKCAWSACTPKTASGCLRIRAGHTDAGSNFKCCGTGSWSFCLSSCQWSTTCESCSQGAPDFCTECY